MLEHSVPRRTFLTAALAAAAAGVPGRAGRSARNKRDIMFSLLDGSAPRDYVPAGFFLHFDKSFHFGQASVQKHLEYFRHTDMDFVKIQYERTFPPLAEIRRPEDWKRMPAYGLEFFEPQLEAVRGLVREAKKEALVLVTLYSPFMCAAHTTSQPLLVSHLETDPDAVRNGLKVITDSLMLFATECIRAGVDGFYASTQGGEAGRFKNPRVFEEHIKPWDLLLMKEFSRACPFNILHVCDYNAPYSDFGPYLDYPGHVVNCNPQLIGGPKSWKEIAALFKRPCMGGLDRHGVLTTGSPEEIKQAVERVLAEAAGPFILGADCTLPSDISWDRIRGAIGVAHAFKRR